MLSNNHALSFKDRVFLGGHNGPRLAIEISPDVEAYQLGGRCGALRLDLEKRADGQLVLVPEAKMAIYDPALPDYNPYNIHYVIFDTIQTMHIYDRCWLSVFTGDNRERALPEILAFDETEKGFLNYAILKACQGDIFCLSYEASELSHHARISYMYHLARTRMVQVDFAGREDAMKLYFARCGAPSPLTAFDFDDEKLLPRLYTDRWAIIRPTE